jgi:hypothetical protein
MSEKKELIDTINDAVFFALTNLHTATIAKVQTVNAKTIDVQPVINRVVNGESIRLPVFTNVPPMFMQGGGSYTAHPIAVGDYCLLIFTERCFDRWYDGADFQNPSEFRMHDYSDGLAICGVNPLATAITIPALITTRGNAIHTGNLSRTGNLTQTGDIDLTGAIDASGSINGASFSVSGSAGMSGTVTAGGFIMTFTNGLITGLVPVP